VEEFHDGSIWNVLQYINIIVRDIWPQMMEKDDKKEILILGNINVKYITTVIAVVPA